MGVLISFSSLGSNFSAAKEKPYPSKEVNIYVGSPPGGTNDLTGRVIGKVLSKMWGQQVVIVNKAGGTQTVSFSYVANAKPDGYTVAYILNPYLVLKKLEEPSLPYSPEKFTWLGAIARSSIILTVKADSPWKTYEEFVDFGVKNPGKIIFGSDGAGGIQHLLELKFADMVGIKSFTHVPFAGSGPMVQALLGGHINAIITATGSTGAYVGSGDLRYLLYFADKRDPEYPDIPTAKEKGLNLVGGSQGIFAAPKGLPSEIAGKLSKSIKEASANEEVLALYKKIGWRYEYYPPEDCLKLWKEDENLYAKEMKKYGFIK